MNRLTVSLQQSILTLHDRGWSARRIARELDIHRETVGAELKRSKPAKVTAGSEAADPAKPAKVTTGSRSQCEPHRGVIEAAILQGLSAQRIYQDLQTDHAYTGGYESVKRFVRALAAVTPLPFRRLETAPGEQMQVDFGQGAPVVESGKKRRPHLPMATWLRPWIEAAEGPLVAYRGKPVRKIAGAFQTLRDAAGFGRDVTSYTIRHTIATEMAARGVPELEIAAIMGQHTLPIHQARDKHAKSLIESGSRVSENRDRCTPL